MATSNFWTQDIFPLMAIDDSDMDYIEAHEFYSALKEHLDEANDGLMFFRITVKIGYYCGSQFYIELTEDADNAGFTEKGAQYADNESCRDYLYLCLSEAKRKYAAEQRKVCKLIRKIGADWGFEEYIVTARFSNGETWYTKAEQATQRERIKAALLAE